MRELKKVSSHPPLNVSAFEKCSIQVLWWSYDNVVCTHLIDKQDGFHQTNQGRNAPILVCLVRNSNCLIRGHTQGFRKKQGYKKQFRVQGHAPHPKIFTYVIFKMFGGQKLDNNSFKTISVCRRIH